MNRLRLAVAIVAAAVAGTAAAVVLARSEDPETKVAAARSPAPPSATATAVMTTTTVASTSTTHLTLPPTTRLVTTTSPTTAPVVDEPPTTTTTTPPSTVTAVSEPRDGTSDGKPPAPVCESSMFVVRFALSKATFRSGESVTGTATFTNASGATCSWAGWTTESEAFDASGARVGVGTAVVADNFQWLPLAAGETSVQGYRWEPTECREAHCTPVPLGTYRAVLTSHPFGTAAATFQLAA